MILASPTLPTVPLFSGGRRGMHKSTVGVVVEMSSEVRGGAAESVRGCQDAVSDQGNSM